MTNSTCRPILYSSSQPTLFSIDPTTQTDGVWLILALDPEEAYLEMKSSPGEKITTPQSLATRAFPLLSKGHRDHLTPRDQWLQGVWSHLKWTFHNRYTFRLTWAPNFFIHADVQVHNARSMLAKGKITWKANEEDMESLQQDQELASEDASVWPCPRLYVHILAKEDKVQIPPRRMQGDQDRGNVIWKVFEYLAEWYLGALVGDGSDGGDSTPIPVHLILEPLYLGVIPQTALGFLAVLVPLLAVAAVWIVPPLSQTLHRFISSEEQRLKVD
jgi:hypothetical protein